MKTKNRLNYQPLRRLLLGAGALTLATLTGQVYLSQSSAATYAANAQAEAATRSGNAQTVSNAAASGSAALLFGGGSCTTTATALQDQYHPANENYTDSLPHSVPGKALVYFVTAGLTSEYATYVVNGAKEWSKSACIDARTASACPARSSCITMRLASEYPGEPNTLGITELTYGDEEYLLGSWVIAGGSITMYTKAFTGAPASAKQATMIHEMGHAIGLEHRATRYKLLYPTSYSQTASLPDATDYANLLYLYGRGSTPTGAAGLVAPGNGGTARPPRTITD